MYATPRNEQHQSPANPRLEVHFATGIVRVRGASVDLSQTERALLFSIARHRHPSTRAQLIDLVWGDDATDQTQNAFNVALHRLRRKLGGCDAIAFGTLGYSLCDGAVVDLATLEALARTSKSNGPVSDRELEALRRAYEPWRRSAGLISERHEWLEATSHRARALAAELGVAFGRKALQHGNTATALDVADELLGQDGCDEHAADLAISAWLQRGDRTEALRVYRRYAEELRRELGLRPSRHVAARFEEYLAG